MTPGNPPILTHNPVLGMVADTGLWLRPVQYERTARAAGNAQHITNVYQMINNNSNNQLLSIKQLLNIIHYMHQSLTQLP